MPKAMLTIETPSGEELEIAIDELPAEWAALSDSRAQMSDFTKIAKALGLADDADEDSILAKLADHAPTFDATKVAEALGIDQSDEDAIVTAVTELRESKPAADEVSIKKADLDQLTTNAARGAKAADELRQMRFDSAFSDALRAGRVDAKDETRERFGKLYDLDPDTTVETLASLPKVVNTEAHGSGAGKGEAPEGVDPDRFDLDRAAQALVISEKIDYETALGRVLAERSQS